MKNAMVIPIVLVVTLMIMILVGTYISATSTYISKEYYRDLAEVRGYWGAYGAKEMNVSLASYDYGRYKIDVNRTGDKYKWNWALQPVHSGLSSNDVYTRELILAEDNVSILFYKKP